MNLMSRNLVLGVLALVLAIPTGMQLYADADTFVDVGRIPLMFQGFTSDNAGAVLIAEPTLEQAPPPANPDPNQPPTVDYNELVLTKADGTWRIGQLPNQIPDPLVGAPVKTPRLEADVFHHLRMIRKDPDTLVQSNATDEQLKKYGLDPQHAYLIKVVDKAGQNVLAEVFVGDDSSVGRSDTEAVRGVFVRQVGSNDVVLGGLPDNPPAALVYQIKQKLGLVTTPTILSLGAGSGRALLSVYNDGDLEKLKAAAAEGFSIFGAGPVTTVTAA